MNFNVVVCWKGEASILCSTLLCRNEGRKLRAATLWKVTVLDGRPPPSGQDCSSDIFKGEEKFSMKEPQVP